MEPLPDPAIPISQREPRTLGGNAAFHNFHNDYSHINDPNLRRRLALAEIDKVPFGWYHVRAVGVAGIGFFTDSYSLFAINLVTSFLGMVYWQGDPVPGSNSDGNHGILPGNVNTAIKAATSAGAVVGQLGFGFLADVVGRRKMYGVELAIIILATMAQALAAPSGAITITGLLIFWRVIMGIGIGGDYPLSAVITSEFAPTRWRGAMMAAVFSMQGAGQVGAALVALVTTVAFKNSFLPTTTAYSSCQDQCILAADRSWRIIIAFGAFPACFALYYRITIPETPRYTFDIGRDVEKGAADIKAYMNNQKEGVVDPVSQLKTKQRLEKKWKTPPASWRDAFNYFSQWKNFKVIFGTSASWLLLDLAFYGLGLNNSTVLDAIGFSAGPTIYHNLRNIAVGNLVLVCAGSLPGYWLSVFTIDTIGRKTIQLIGFILLTIIFCIIGFAYNSLSSRSLLVLYIFAQFFFNFGPNTTTFIIPGECFPTRYRSTGHGFSAAMGKIGAIIAQVMAQPLLTKGAQKNCKGHECSPWLDRLMQIFALFMFCGTLVSLLVPETKGHTLEELAGEGPAPFDGGGGGGGGSGDVRDGHNRPKMWWRKGNLIGGGKPAGWSWNRDSPHLGPKSPGLRGKRERIGIMTSPELIPKPGERRRSTWRGINLRGSIGGIGGGGMSNRKGKQGDSASPASPSAAGFSGNGSGSGGRNHQRPSRSKSQNHSRAESRSQNQNHARAESENSGGSSANGKAYTVSVTTSHGRQEEVRDEDLYASGALGGGSGSGSGHHGGSSGTGIGIGSASASSPSWGAGWAVQRNTRRDTVESIMLQDVGSLLK